MPLPNAVRIILQRGALMLVLSGLSLAVSSSGATTNATPNIPSAQQTNRPFVLFRTTRWYPMRPPAEAITDNLTLAVFVAIPVVTLLALRKFFRKTNATSRNVRGLHLITGNLLLLLLLLSVSLLLAEAWYRFFVDTTDSLGFTKISERWVTRHWQANSAGPRDNLEYAPKIQAGKRRVTFVGDSFAAGHGIKNVEDRFANRLRAMHPAWEIHLLANVGLDTQSEINLLEKALARGYELDEVVLVYCLNDVCDLLMAQGQPFEGKLPSLEQTGPWFIRGSYFLDLFYNRYLAARNPYVQDYFAFVKAGYRGDYWDAQKQRLIALRDLVQTNGGHLSVVTFPFLHALGPGYEYQFVHEEFHEFWTEQQVPHLDLLPTYAGYSSRDLTVNAHDAHPNELANQLVLLC